MASRWSGLAIVGLLLGSFAGCSGESTPGSHTGGTTHSGGAAQTGGKSQAGKGGGHAGSGGSHAGSGGSMAARGGSAGHPPDESGAGGEEVARGGAGRGGQSVGGRGGGVAGGGVSGGTAVGGRAGNGGMTLTGGAGGTGGAPFSWSCRASAYHDGVCDCGCAVADPDCVDGDVDHCERCNVEGACNGAECPGHIDPDNTARCESAPLGWSCSNRYYDDGESCDCGCGIKDPDCKDDKATSCDACQDFGACSHGPCPSSIAADDNSTCFVPQGWLCGFDYGDGTCDCGCGVVDVDCDSEKAAACEFCPPSGCAPFGCSGAVDPDHNEVCTVAPPGWTCPARLYNDGTGCDCGCGFPDPDCKSQDISACDRCNDPYSCSGQACPGIIDASNNAFCSQPAPPPEWKCGYYYWLSDRQCSCGCGAPDPDCRGTTTDFCDGCPICGPSNCPAQISPTDISQCKPAPAGWTCDSTHYLDNVCDCGCGITDPDCLVNSSTYCYSCPVEGCSVGYCSRILPHDTSKCVFDVPSTWKCARNFYGDGLCDCGCGAVDRDCASANVGACAACKDEGGCSTTSCPGTIAPTDNSTCSP
jgi:hypothetical protein